MFQGAVVVILVLLALAFWAGLALFMNYRPPDLLNQAVFLAIWGAAIACVVIPLSYGVNSRLRGFLGRRWVLEEATRQGVMVAALATILMGLHFIGALNLLVGGLLTLVVVVVEAFIYLKDR